MSQVAVVPHHPRRGDLWLAQLDPTLGHEQAGRRPVLVISTDAYNTWFSGLVIVVPLTSTIRAMSVRVPVYPPEVQMPSDILCDQIRAVSLQRLGRRLGAVAPATIEQVEAVLRFLLAL